MTPNGKHTFDQLVSGYCDQSLTAPEFARLDELLAASPDLRQRFMQLTALHGSLAWVCAARDKRLADGAPPPALRRHPWLRTAGVLLNLAAAFLVALYLGQSFRQIGDADQPAARIVELSGSGELLLPDGPIAPLALHQELVVGQTLRLADADGTAVVEYRNGARLHLGAGTTMHLLASPAPAGGAGGSNKVFLAAGVVRAEAAQLAAASLILATPHAEVLGTTFTCSVGAEATRVELEEGRAQLVRQADGMAVELVPGSYVVSTADVSADLAPRKLVNEVLIPRSHVRLSGPALALSLDGQRLATVSQNQFTFWNTRTGQSEFSLPTRRAESACVAFAPDGRTLAASGPEGAVVCWDLPLRSERRRWAATRSVQSLAYSTDGRWLAGVERTPGAPDAVQLWDATTGQDVRRWSGPSGQVLALAVAPDRAHVAGATSDRGVVIWNAATGEERAVLKATPKRERAEIVAYSPNGRWLAAGYSGKSEIRLWDAGSLVSKAGFAGLGRQFRSVVFSPDGSLLAAGTQDGTLFLWRLEDSVELLSRRVDVRPVRLLAFTADSRTLTVVGESGVFQQWATAPE